MSYVIFARKFRPQTFEEVIGQDPVRVTLKNAIEQKRIPQSFLFSGPRGVGKTSVARILAKALNCAEGPTALPCGRCESCREITESNSLDVLEIDGASNRGIDEIRNLRETVKFKPVTGKFKIYIIDEVHMLTTEAFNALLKTLEEPPAHVKFIFATTEPHKVPLTILSRCQRFNFKRITLDEITGKLAGIAKKEKLKHGKNALYLIAKASEGALRDAESLLDQLASFSKDKITEEDVLFMLGLAGEDLYFRVLDALAAKDMRLVFSLVSELYDGGKDLVQFAGGLFEIFRNLILFQCAESVEEFIEISEEGMRELKKRKDLFTRGELLLGLSLLSNLQSQLRRNLAPPRLLVEASLLKILHIGDLRPTQELSESLAGEARTEVSGRNEKVQREPRAANQKKTSETPLPGGPSPEKSGTFSLKSPQTGTSSPSLVITLNEVETIWPRIIDYVKSKRMSVGIFLSEAAPVEITDRTVVLGLPIEFQFHKDTLERQVNKSLVEEAFEVIAGKKVGVQFVITQSPADDSSQEEEPSKQGAAHDTSDLPDIILGAMDIFDGAKIVRKD